MLKHIFFAIQKHVRRFIWDRKGNGKGLLLVNWDHVTSPKTHGGLGVQVVRHSNVAFLGKVIAGINDKEMKL